jgi:tellurite resistance protein TehA-like permease
VTATQPTSSEAGAIATLHPAYFAMVMATGIVSIAAFLHGLTTISWALFVANLVFYPALWVLTALRFARYRERLVADFSHHARAVGFFTTVAATCVFGSQWIVIARMWTVATTLWFVGVVLWAGLVYGVFTVLTVKADKPTLVDGLNGGWLVSVVATQSVSVLGSQVASGFADPGAVLFVSLALWLGGGMLYIWLISLIFYRYTFFTMSPADLAPPYWINMGAVAISTLAGALLIDAAPQLPLLADLLPFLKGMTLLFWSTATWWIPMLVILGVWRHVIRRFPLRYDPLYWGAVFPLGMYTVSTFRMARAIEVPWLLGIPRLFVFVALLAWAIAIMGFTLDLVGRLRSRRRSTAA